VGPGLPQKLLPAEVSGYCFFRFRDKSLFQGGLVSPTPDRHFAWLKYFTYRLVPILTPNYKLHILSPAEVRKVCYSLAELYVKYVYLNLIWRKGRDVNETL
jgi:hypothetical protein